MNTNPSQTSRADGKPKILLAILPYWDPMIPPMGIASLKGFLQKHGYSVHTEDLIVKQECLEFYDNYFQVLKKCVPPEKRGNFNNIGHDVLQNHMMAHQKYQDEALYRELVRILIHHSYYVDAADEHVRELNRIMEDFYRMLEACFIALLEREQPDVLGVTAFKCTLPASLFVLRLAKRVRPAIRTLMGGGTFNESHALDSPSFEALLAESRDYLDHIIIGQGELLFLEYLRGGLPAGRRVYTKADIDNRILQFHEMDIPDFSDLDLQKYPYLSATASASCLYQCSFCVATRVAGKYRMKDPRQTVREMVSLYEKYGHQLFFMTDSMLNPVASDLAREFIKIGISLYYDAYFRVDDASADIRNTLLWRRGGMYRVRLGTESGSLRVLEMMGKGITPDQIRAAISGLAYAGIKTTTYWVIGHPGETEEDFQATLDLIGELRNDIFQAECNPFLYHFSQQNSADAWAPHRRLLYPEEMSDMLVFRSWTLDVEPLREEAYRRMHRFENHCRRLGIPNPYSYNEHIAADERWRRLHKNAVPPLLDFMIKEKYINDTLQVRMDTYARPKRDAAEDFNL